MERSILFIFYVSCLMFAIGSSLLQSANAFGTVAEEWCPPINFGPWLEYIRQTSDPDPTIYGMAPTESYLPTELKLPNADPQTGLRTMEGNLFISKRKIVVDKSGKGDFRTIQAAVNAVAHENRERVTIRIRPGVYKERVRIPKDKPYITFQGYPNLTIITFDSIASDVKSPKDNTTLSTFGSATVGVDAMYFFAINIIFQNSASIPPPGSVGKQAVALRISGDMAAFYNCQFLGGQDTLYDHHGRHYFENCYVEGTIDFVFGNGRSLYKNCILNALDNYGAPGSVTAQKRNPNTLDTGFSFVDSSVTGTGQVYLGRAWGNYSRVVFARTYMGDVVIPVGWDDWGIKDRERTAFYAEFNCTGPGAQTSGRAPWSRIISAKEAKPFLSSAFINGRQWLPRDYHDLINSPCSSAICGAPAKASTAIPPPGDFVPAPRDLIPPEIKPSTGFVLRKIQWRKLVMIIFVTGSLLFCI
ncbi:hypothetical protein R1flu_027758 [Riccia fluitans]|uniref:Pectinesterase n=1 Tax=Riccia fluitans TaxID=41844 RepID=A0ABD1XJQ4_9MARC